MITQNIKKLRKKKKFHCIYIEGTGNMSVGSLSKTGWLRMWYDVQMKRGIRCLFKP